MYVAIEGIDTCGKSTQIELLKSYYPQAIFTKEPGGSVIGESIRNLILFESRNSGLKLDSYAEFFLFLADRAQHYSQVLLPNMNNLIISDRSAISGIAYALDIDIAQSVELNTFALRGCFPDLVVLLEISKECLIQRLAQKVNDSIESRGVEYMLEIQERLLQALKFLELDYITIDASLPRDEVFAEITKAINAR